VIPYRDFVLENAQAIAQQITPYKLKYKAAQHCIYCE